MKKCGIIGAGAWGTAISTLIQSKNTKIYIWSRNKKTVKSINNNNKNEYLKGIKLPKKLIATSKLRDLGECDYFFIATPTQKTSSIISDLSKFKIKQNFIICSKGIEIKSGNFLNHVIKKYFNKANIAAMSGPCFADEVARKLPTAVLLSTKNKIFFNNINKLINNKNFRLYYSDDILGCQLGGAIKNVYAIGSGIVNGLKLGENARSAFISRSFAEILRLSKKMGAKEKTLIGLSGLGDLILTCNSKKSRNTVFGEIIVKNKGKKIINIIQNKKTVTEGYYTTKALFNISKKYKIQMPILQSIYNILFLSKRIDKEIKLILGRRIKKEFY
tara:strand:+ start:562 stop:1554 length:993 start_codon:yes stop_codon:yes gene_type:complete